MLPDPPRSLSSSTRYGLGGGVLRVTFSKLRLLQILMTALLGSRYNFNYRFREIGKGLVIKNAAKMGKIQKCQIFPPFYFLTFSSKISNFRVLMRLNWIKLRPKIILNYQGSF